MWLYIRMTVDLKKVQQLFRPLSDFFDISDGSLALVARRLGKGCWGPVVAALVNRVRACDPTQHFSAAPTPDNYPK